MIRTPSSCIKWDKTEDTYLSPVGEIEDFEFGEILKDEYRHIISNFSTNSKIYALAANNYCHWTSLYNLGSGLTLDIHNLTVESNKEKFAIIPPGSKEDWLGVINSMINEDVRKAEEEDRRDRQIKDYNLNKYVLDSEADLLSEDEALPNSFSPIAVKSDTNDNIFLQKPCKKLENYFHKESYRLLKKLAENSLIKKSIKKINKEEPKISEYLKEPVSFLRIENIYNKLIILEDNDEDNAQWYKKLKDNENFDRIIILYHVYVYAKYAHKKEVRNNVVRPFFELLDKRSIGFEQERKNKKHFKHKPRVMLFSISDKVLAALNSLLFKNSANCFLKLLAKSKPNVMNCPGDLLPGSNLILETLKLKRDLTQTWKLRARVDGNLIELKERKKFVEFGAYFNELRDEIESTRRVTCNNHSVFRFSFNIKKIYDEQGFYTSFLQLIFLFELIIVGYLLFDRFTLKDVQKSVEKVTEMVTSATTQKESVRYKRQRQRERDGEDMGAGHGGDLGEDNDEWGGSGTIEIN